MDARIYELEVGSRSTVHMRIDPPDGGRIVSLSAHGREWLTGSGPRDSCAGFDQPGGGGWDEISPTIRATTYGDHILADHGEAWRRPWFVVARSDRSITTEVDLTTLPIRLQRTITATNDGVLLTYRAQALTTRELPFFWSAHPVFRAPPGTRVVLHRPCSWLHGEYPEAGPIGMPTDGSIDAIPDGQALKAFVDVLQSWAEIRLPDGAGIRIAWGGECLQHLGLYWDRGEFSREAVIGIEPTTARSDSLAEAIESGQIVRLSPRAPVTWWMQVAPTESQ